MRFYYLLILTLISVLCSAASCQSQQPDPHISENIIAENVVNETQHEPPRRIIAIGDVHGDFGAFQGALMLAGLIDNEFHWTGGSTILVQTGDIFDRGDDEREIWEALDGLETEAENAGGEVIRLNGNHEILQAQGDFRYVTEGGMEDYNEFSEGQVSGRQVAFHPGGPWAREMADNKIIVVIDGNVFVHAGVLMSHVHYGIDRINRETSQWLRGEGEMPIILTGENSPIWTRVYSNPMLAGSCDVLNTVLDEMGAERMIVGHTVQRTGITGACDGREWRIDVGMADAYGGPIEVLEIIGDEVRVLQ